MYQTILNSLPVGLCTHSSLSNISLYTYSVCLRSTLSIQMAYQHVLFISLRWYDQTLRHLNDWLLSPWPYWCSACTHNNMWFFSEIVFVFIRNKKSYAKPKKKKIAPCTTILKRLFLPTQKWHTHSAFRSYHNLLIKHMSILCCFFSSFLRFESWIIFIYEV